MRYFYLYILLITTAIITLWNKLHYLSYEKMDLSIYWMSLFFIFTYVVCQYDSGSLCYMLAIEMLAPLLIYLLTIRWVKNPKVQNTVISLIFFTLFIGMSPQQSATRLKFYSDNYFSVTPPVFSKKTKEAITLISYPAFSLNQDPR